jgi:hypothetical protein
MAKSIDLNQAAGAVGSLRKQLYDAQVKGCLAAAIKSVAYIKAVIIPASKPFPPVDLNNYLRAWHFEPLPNGAAVFNKSKPPFVPAGVIEWGIRSGAKTSAVGRAAIAEWALRKGLVKTEKEARGFAYCVARKVAGHSPKGKPGGRKGHHILDRSMATIKRYQAEEIARFVGQVPFGGK